VPPRPSAAITTDKEIVMAKDGKHVKIDSTFITDVKNQLSGVRTQVSVVRGGMNPNDTAHPHGMPLANIQVVAGHSNFQNGSDLKAKVTAVGGQVDQKLSTIDQKLDQYTQNLDHILASADKVELDNMSLTDWGNAMGGGATPPGTGGATPPPTGGANPPPATGH
jgi:hypothetical protein